MEYPASSTVIPSDFTPVNCSYSEEKTSITSPSLLKVMIAKAAPKNETRQTAAVFRIAAVFEEWRAPSYSSRKSGVPMFVTVIPG